jgi:protein-S-isoprenylcysteine O-methyltransferase Ste14
MSAGAHPAGRSRPVVSWTRHVPAYFTSTVWTIYAAWIAITPVRPIAWDTWPLDHLASDGFGWLAVPLLGVALWLFWYSHHTIGGYWSIGVQLKNSHRLVTSGPYRYVRHPLYTALFLGYLGTLLALQSWMLAAWFPAFVVSYVLFATDEEHVMERGFGEAYRVYRRQTGMFLPTWAGIRAWISRASAK